VLPAAQELVAGLRPFDGGAVCFYVRRQPHVISLTGWFLDDGAASGSRNGFPLLYTFDDHVTFGEDALNDP